MIKTIEEAPKYIDLMTDFAFKRVFGTEPNRDLLIAFLNEIFRGRRQIRDLIYNKSEYTGDTIYEGTAIFDLLCTGNDGERFIIEVQRGKQKNFKQRALFYTSRLISEQAPRGNRAGWGYNLTGVYLVALLEDFALQDSPEAHYIHDIYLCNRENGKIFYEGLGYTYIELLKFVKTDVQLETELDKWLFILKNMSKMDKIPAYMRKPIFEKLFCIAEYSNLTKGEKMAYDQNMKYKWDNENVREYAIEEAMNRGLEEGKQEGLRQGVQQGELKSQRDIARNIKHTGLAIGDIAKLTGLSIEEIQKL